MAAAFVLTSLNGLVAWYRPDGRLKPGPLAEAMADLTLRAVLIGADDAPADQVDAG